MTIYFNDENTGYDIEFYNHSFSKEEDGNFNEQYDVSFTLNTDVEQIINNYKDLTITKLTFKKNNTIIKSIDGLQLHLTRLGEWISDEDQNILLTLNT